MKRFIVKIVLFFALVAVVDVLSGFCFNTLRSKAKGGNTEKREYIAHKCDADILILGSSKAARHYVPSILSDSLGMSCYNCGEPGNGIICAKARYEMVKSRYTPKVVLYELTPRFDYLEGDYTQYLGVLKPYYDSPAVKSAFAVFGDELDGLRMMSSMYRSNSRLLSELGDMFRNPFKEGFEPLYGNLSKFVETNESTKTVINPDATMVDHMKNLIEETKADGVRLFFILSPSFKSPIAKDGSYAIARSLAEAEGIPYIDFTEADGITGNSDLFVDHTHLNQDGANFFTSMVAHVVKEMI